MDEEDKLTSQLEKEQDLALETAIQEEESWLKELAREENTVIEVETETETENELGVGNSAIQEGNTVIEVETETETENELGVGNSAIQKTN